MRDAAVTALGLSRVAPAALLVLVRLRESVVAELEALRVLLAGVLAADAVANARGVTADTLVYASEKTLKDLVDERIRVIEV